MNYDKIIVELMGRIQTLEENVATLMKKQEKETGKEERKMTTDDIREHIKELKRVARAEGKEKLILRAGTIHNELGLKQRHPVVCNAMRDCMEIGDVILFQPPKGNSSTLEIEYKL